MITSTHRSTPYYDPLADDSVITRYLAEITTLESLDPSYCNLTFPRQKFVDELPKEIGRRIFRPVALHIFGGGAGELLLGPAGTDVDICISRRTFREYDISAVGSILLESAISFLWECNRIAKRSALFCPERIVHAYGLTIHPHGDTILLKIRSGLKTESDRFCNAFDEDDFYIDRESIEDAIKHKSMFNIIHNNSILKIDFVIRKGAPYRRIEFERRRKIDLDGTQIWIVAPEDLIISKLLWSKDRSSDIQLRDVKNLLTSVGDLDEEYITQWVQALDLESIYKKVKIDE